MKVRLRVVAGEGSERTLIRMAGASAAAHLGALIVFSLLPRFVTPRMPPRATVAEIIPASSLRASSPGISPPRSGPTPSQRAEAARKAAVRAREPEPPRARPDPTVPPLAKAPKKKEPPRPDPEPAAPPREQPDEEPETAPGPSGQEGAGPGSGSAASGISFGGSSGPGGIPSIGSSAFPFDYYRSSLVAILQSNWRRPLAADGLADTQRCRVQFTILKSGIIRDPRVVVPSGNEILDQSALRAVYESNPLPPLPFQYGHESVSAEVQFELTPD